MGDAGPMLSAPRLAPGHLHRARLIELLDAAAEASLIFVHAPAGGGKSNLVAEWVRHRAPNESCIWIGFGEREATPEQFWAELRFAVRRLTGVRATDPDEIATALNWYGRPVSVVIDDAHHADAELREELVRFIRELHVGRVVALTRTLEWSSLRTLRLQVRTEIISAQDLAFTEAEVAELIAKQTRGWGRRSHRADAAAVFAASGGHPLLLRQLLAVPHTKAEGLVRFATSAWAAASMSSEARGTALELVFAPEFDAGLAAQITGVPRPAELLAEFARSALGTVDETGFFRFYPAVQSAVGYRARREIPESRQQEIRALAADYLRRADGHEEAILAIFADGGEYDDMWLLFAAKLTDQMPHATALAGASPLSASLGVTEESATVAAVMQSAREPIPSIGLLRLVDRALEELQGSPPKSDPEAAVYHEVAIEAMLWAAHRFAEGSARAQVLLRLAEELNPSATSGVWAAAYWGLLYSAVMLALAGDLSGSERVLRMLGSDRDAQRRSRRAAQLAFIHAMRGEAAAAGRLLESLPRVMADSLEWTAKLTIARAVVRLERGDAERALAMLREMEEELVAVREWPHYLIALSRAHAAIDPRVGLEDLNRLMGSHGQRPIAPRVLDMLDAARADLALAAGEVGQAMRIVARRGRADVAQRLTAARIALVVPDPNAISDLRELIDENEIWPLGRATAFALLAVHLHRQGDRRYAGEALRSALAITGGRGIELISSPVPRSEVVEIAARAGLELPEGVREAGSFEWLPAPVLLTPRERVLLGRLMTPARLRDIAEQEFVTLHTIKSQVSSIYRKLGVRSRAAAVHEAHRLGLLGVGEPGEGLPRIGRDP